jgi:exopolysaccharide biosynthesis protein
MITVDLDAIRGGRLALDVALGGDLMGRTASTQAIGTGSGAIAAMNGPYFASSGSRTYPLGFTAINGRIAQIGNLMRPLVGIDPDGEFQVEVAQPKAFVTSDAYFEPIWLYGVNNPAANNAVTLFDSNWGTTVNAQGGVAVGVSPDVTRSEEIVIYGPYMADEEMWDGEVVEVSSGSVTIPDGGYALVFRGSTAGDAERYQVGNRTAVYTYELPLEWVEMDWIATLGPWFVHDGHERDYSEETQYGGNILGRARRSIIGLTWNDEVFMAITGGPALSVAEAVEVMIECNAREAIMCDSGGSSGMWVGGTSGVGAIGASRQIPLAFVVREPGENWEGGQVLKVWEGSLFRY